MNIIWNIDLNNSSEWWECGAHSATAASEAGSTVDTLKTNGTSGGTSRTGDS